MLYCLWNETPGGRRTLMEFLLQGIFVSSTAIARSRSEIRDPMKKGVATSTNIFHYTAGTINLDYCLAHLDNNWTKLRMMKEKYGEEVINSDPSTTGSVLWTSKHETISIDKMVKEFEITLLDEYLDNSREYRHQPGIME